MKKLFLFISLFLATSPCFSGAKLLHPTNAPHSTTLPATCSQGDIYQDTDATSGQQWYLCESANTWVLQGDGGSGGGGSSALAVTTGSAQGMSVLISSPTSIINFSSATHSVRLTGGSTAYVELTNNLPSFSTSYWNYPSTGTFIAPDAIINSTITITTATIRSFLEVRDPSTNGSLSYSTSTNHLRLVHPTDGGTLKVFSVDVDGGGIPMISIYNGTKIEVGAGIRTECQTDGTCNLGSASTSFGEAYFDGNVTLTALNSNQFVKTNASDVLISASGVSLSSEVFGTLPIGSLTTGASTYIQNTQSLQQATFTVLSGRFANFGDTSSREVRFSTLPINGGVGPQVIYNYDWNKTNHSLGEYILVVTTAPYYVTDGGGPYIPATGSAMLVGPSVWSITYYSSSNPLGTTAFSATEDAFEVYNANPMRVYDSDNDQYVGIKSSAALSASNDFVFVSTIGAAGDVMTTDGARNFYWNKPADVIGSFGITIDGGGAAITTGVKGSVRVPYACTIQDWYLLADQTGSIVIDVWKDVYTNYPPTVADTIAGSEKPTLSSADDNRDTALGTWTTSVAKDDIIQFNVDSAATVTRVNLTIKCARN